MPRKRHPGPDRLRTITIFAPVPEPALDELTERLRALKNRPSPFTAMSNTHFARLAVLARNTMRPQPRPRGMHLSARLLDLLTHAGRAQRQDPPSLSYLIFSASYDVTARIRDDAGYVDELRVRLGADADELWGLCSDYPGWTEPARFRAFFAQRTLPPAGYVFSASDDEPSVGQIRAALELRRQVIELAVDADGLAEDQLAKQIRQVFADAGAEPAGPAAGPDPAQQVGTDPGTGGQLPAEVEVEPALVDPLLPGDRVTPAGRVRTDPDLADVQNLVTSGYPRHLASRHLLLRITDPPAARRWLARAADVIPTAEWAEAYVDRIGGPADDTLPDDPLPDDPRTDGGPAAAPSSPDFAVHLALSYAGLVRLGLPEAELAGFASEFQAGMAGREPGLTPGRGISSWQPPFVAAAQRGPDGDTGPEATAAPGVHLLVLFSATDADALDARLAERPDLLPSTANGLQLLQVFEANRIPTDHPDLDPGLDPAADATEVSAGRSGFREHFGFVDGLSQPRIHGVTAGRRTAELPAGEALLGYQDVDGDTAGAALSALSPALARNGSYLVYRKLEQDVPAFRELTQELGRRLEAQREDGNPEAPTDSDGPADSGGLVNSGGLADPQELAAAKLMGRWRDGTPLTLSADGSNAALARQPFGFQEDDAQGLKCPVGAHIRRANPRDSRPVDPDSELKDGAHAGLETSLALRHRMLRRGIPYGTPLPASDPGDQNERGLLFIALVGDIRRQFEFIQAHWMSDGNAFRLGSDRDVLSGAAPQDTKIVVQGLPPTFMQPARPLVTCRGGEYFFLPGIRALRRIAAG